MQNSNPETLMEQIREEVLAVFRTSPDMDDACIKEQINRTLLEYGNRHYLTIVQKERLADDIFYSLRRLGVLQELVEDVTVSEIMINGPDSIFVERGGKLEKWEKKFPSKENLETVIQQIVAKTNRMVNETNPIVDTRLENGARVNVVLEPIALNGPVVTIRRFPENPYDMEALVLKGSISEEICGFLKMLVAAGYNIFISGGTGSGKTTFLNALSGYIPKEERVITIEDSAELNLQSVKNLVRLETRNANVEGRNEISIRDLIRTALRMRPDRIIVGEVRGKEALDMLQAMNTGHDGSLSTGHANSCKDMVKRLETMVLMGNEIPISAIRGQIASGIDIMIHLGRLRDRTRKVLSVEEIIGYEQGEILFHTLFRFEEKGERDGIVQGTWEKTGELRNREKLYRWGIEMEKK